MVLVKHCIISGLAGVICGDFFLVIIWLDLILSDCSTETQVFSDWQEITNGDHAKWVVFKTQLSYILRCFWDLPAWKVSLSSVVQQIENKENITWSDSWAGAPCTNRLQITKSHSNLTRACNQACCIQQQRSEIRCAISYKNKMYKDMRIKPMLSHSRNLNMACI